MHLRLAAILGVALPCLLLPIVAVHAQTPIEPAAGSTPTQGQALIDKVGPAIVTVHVVVKVQVKSNGQSQSVDTEIPTEGVVVTPDGLIMISNAPVSSDVLKDMLGGGGDDGRDLSVSPTDFKVTIGNEEKQYTGFLAATDEKLGLAFVKIEDLADRKLAAIDFSKCPSIGVGDQVGAVTRLGKGYDYAPVYSQGPVKGAVTKPRPAYLLSTTIMSVGLPVFTLEGAPVGMMVFLPVGVDADSASSMDIMMRYYSGAAADRLGIFLIAGATVEPIILEAIDQAAKLAADRAKNPPAKADAPVAPAKPAPKAGATPTAPAAH